MTRVSSVLTRHCVGRGGRPRLRPPLQLEKDSESAGRHILSMTVEPLQRPRRHPVAALGSKPAGASKHRTMPVTLVPVCLLATQ